jgi:hypothetical protein
MIRSNSAGKARLAEPANPLPDAGLRLVFIPSCLFRTSLISSVNATPPGRTYSVAGQISPSKVVTRSNLRGCPPLQRDERALDFRPDREVPRPGCPALCRGMPWLNTCASERVYDFSDAERRLGKAVFVHRTSNSLDVTEELLVLELVA